MELYQDIADYITDVGTSRTSNGSYYVYFNDIVECFDVSEDWIKEQNKDHIYSKPITLDIIESNVQLTSLEDMLILESGRSDYRRLSDIDLCREIDTIIKNELHGTSVYTISYEDKMNLFNRLRRQLHIGETQLSRCLAMKYKP